MIDDISKILLSEPVIQSKVAGLGQRITNYYAQKGVEEITVIGILNGSAIFVSDLIRKIKIPIRLDFIKASSYGQSTTSSGSIKITKDLDIALTDSHVLLVDDIVDTGYTMQGLTKLAYSRDAASVKICTLLDKPERRETNIEIDWHGFEIPDEFVVGYGLDYAGKYRQLPYIGILNRSIYE